MKVATTLWVLIYDWYYWDLGSFIATSVEADCRKT